MNLSKIILIIPALFFALNLFSQNSDFPDNKYLLIMDMQDFNSKHRVSEDISSEGIKVINSIIDTIDDSKVIYACGIHRLLNISLRYPFIYGTTDSLSMEIDDRMKKVSDNIFYHEGAVAFNSTQLVDFLKINNVKNILVVGFLSGNFLEKTVLEGIELGYNMYVFDKALIARSEKQRNKTLKHLEKSGAKLLKYNN
jgi:nicotinamidase-related amidase